MGWGCRVLGSLLALPELSKLLSGVFISTNWGSAQLSVSNALKALHCHFFSFQPLFFLSSAVKDLLHKVHNDKNACLICQQPESKEARLP